MLQLSFLVCSWAEEPQLTSSPILSDDGDNDGEGAEDADEDVEMDSSDAGESDADDRDVAYQRLTEQHRESTPGV